MNNKNKIRLMAGIAFLALIILVGIYIKYSNDNKEYLVGIGYDEILDKIDKKENFVLCVSSTTCSHCAQFKPKLKEVANQYKVELYYTDVDKYSDEDKKEFDNVYNVSGTPTTLIFIDGKEVSVMSRIEGDVSKDKIINTLNKYEFIKK